VATDKHYNYIIVGAGIAGLATAELLTRSGFSVALIEKNDKVCQEASGEHHGWFHFGSLYSIFRSNQFMRTLVGGIDDMLAYYSHFPGMNISVGDSGRLQFAHRDKVWIRDEPIEYIVAARNNPDFNLKSFDGVRNYAKKIFFTLTWEMAIKQFISRHDRFHHFNWNNGSASEWIPKAGWKDYARDVISKPDLTDVNLDPNTHFRVVGFDRPMNAPVIVADLLDAFLAQGGDLITSTEYKGYVKDDDTVIVNSTSGKFSGNRLLLSCGRFFKDMLPLKKVKVVASPILVAYPQLYDRSFVRLTPFMDKTINHLCHEVNGVKYSVVGGGYYADPNNVNTVESSKKELEEMAFKVFPKLQDASLHEVYVGHKTELVADAGERNYQYHIQTLDENVWALLPGKFSLGFSLAVNAYKYLVGSEAIRKPELVSTKTSAKNIGLMLHQRMVLKHVQEKAG